MEFNRTLIQDTIHYLSYLIDIGYSGRISNTVIGYRLCINKHTSKCIDIKDYKEDILQFDDFLSKSYKNYGLEELRLILSFEQDGKILNQKLNHLDDEIISKYYGLNLQSIHFLFSEL